ncbi:MAG: M1 family metallopeptidase [Hyphomonas sp.]|nr:M1 family metallopeptidase [Hyphomonas sp.]
MTPRTSASVLLGAASLLVLAACTTPEPAAETTAEPTAPAEVAPIRLEEPPTGQLPADVHPVAYRLDLVTDPHKDSFTGHEEIDISMDGPHARIWLHDLGPDVSSLKAVLPDGTEIAGTITTGVTEDGVSRIDFDTPLPSGAATLVMDFTAPYDRNLAGLYKVEQAGRPYLVTQMEASDARRMFVSFDEPRFKTPYTLTVTAPVGMAIAANGALDSSEDAGNSMTTYHFKTTRPIQSYLVALMVGPYDSVTAAPVPPNDIRGEPVPLRAFAAAGKGSQLTDVLAITPAIIDYQEHYFDYPYPYGKLDLIAAADFAYGAMENAGAIVYREAALLIDEHTSLARRRGIFSTNAHEIAHQWFGDLVTPAWWDDIWLNEAFATWMASKTMNAVDPDGGWKLSPVKSSLNAMPLDSLASTRQIRNPIEKTGDINDAFDSITYQKGASVLNMFETYLGEDAFRDGIRLHMKRHADGNATVDDFMQSLADGSGQPDVVPAFRSYIMQPGIPYLDISLSCPDGGQPGLTITQSRYAPLGSTIDTGAQTWQVPFAAEVHDSTGTHVVRRMLTDKTTEIPLDDGCADWVMPNAGGAGYWRFIADADDAAALRANFTALDAGEQMMLLDSQMAGFNAGKVSTADLMADAQAAMTGAPDTVAQSLGVAGKLHGLLGDEGRTKLAAWVEATYGPAWNALSAKPEADKTDADRLLAPQLWNTLLTYGQRTDERAAMASSAKAYLGIGQDADAAALSPEDLGTAVSIGVRDGGRAFYDGALAYTLASDNQTERSAILYALAGSGSDEDLADLFKRALGDEITGSELYTIYAGAMGNEKGRPAFWQLAKDNFATLVAKMPSVRRPQLARATGNFCTADEVADAETFFKGQADLISGYERSLAQGVEAGTLCATLKEAKSAEVEAAFAE